MADATHSPREVRRNSSGRLIAVSRGGRCVVQTALEVRGGKIVRQVDVVVWDAPADREEDICPGVAKGEGK